MTTSSPRSCRRGARNGACSDILLHATCVAFPAGGRSASRSFGVLLLGPSGSGKSDLALRLIHEQGARLVADDQVHLVRQRGRAQDLIAGPAPRLAGLIEVRGLGILRLPSRQLAAQATITLAVALVPAREVERLPEPWADFPPPESWPAESWGEIGAAGAEGVEYLGIPLPLLRLSPFEASAALKVRLAVGLRSGSIRRFA